MFALAVAAFFITLNLSGAGFAQLDSQSFKISIFTGNTERGFEIQWSEGTRYSIDGTTQHQLWQRPFIRFFNSPRSNLAGARTVNQTTATKGKTK
ncbi:MAG TPA: hypothetical protein VN873_20470 [Candidatus Angelobacter sp.]|nr:hypothetical protein [Candidatus Angelobacter sp.]